MSLFERWNIERKLRWLHGWLGALILPWIVIAGLTGLYMNHRDLVRDYLPDSPLPDAAAYVATTGAHGVDTPEQALAVASRFRPAETLGIDRDQSYAGRDVWTVKSGKDEVVVDRETGFVWVVTRYVTTAYAPDGQRLGAKYRWSRILSSLHERGWVGTRFGNWPADITATALVVFGLSGIVLFWSPRLRRARNRRARERAGL